MDKLSLYLWTAAFLLACVALLPLLITFRKPGRYIQCEAARLHYTVDGAGEPLVLLHGFAVHSDLNWRRPGLTRLLARHFRVISLDLRGHGLSDKPHDRKCYGLSMVDDVIRLLDQLNIEKSHLIGYSLGGFIALKAAASHADRFNRVVIMGAGWVTPDDSTFFDNLAHYAETLESCKPVKPLLAWISTQRHRPGVLQTWGERLLTRYFNDRQALAALIKSLPELALSEHELSRITAPLCLIIGSRDPLRGKADALAGRTELSCYQIIENSDHINTLLRKQTRNILLDFLLKNVDPSPARSG